MNILFLQKLYMTYFRPQSIEHIHNKLSEFTFSLTPTRQVSSLLTYLRTYGIVHSLISGQSIKARDHMYQLEFFIEYINAQQFSTAVLKTCRVLDINEEKPNWNRLISSIEEPVHEHQVLLMDFCNFANWFGSAEKIARWILDHSEVNSDIWQQSILGLSDTLRDLGRHDEAILELEQLKNISTSFETMMRIQSSLSVIYLHQNNLEMVKKTLIPYLDFCRNFGTLKDQANALHNIGSMYRKLGDYLLSKEAYEEAIAIRNQEFGRNHIQTLMSQQSLAI